MNREPLKTLSRPLDSQNQSVWAFGVLFALALSAALPQLSDLTEGKLLQHPRGSRKPAVDSTWTTDVSTIQSQWIQKRPTQESQIEVPWHRLENLNQKPAHLPELMIPLQVENL